MEIYDDDPRAQAKRLRKPSPPRNHKAPAFQIRHSIAEDYYHPRDAIPGGRLRTHFNHYSDTAPRARVGRLTPSNDHYRRHDRETGTIPAREGHDTLHHRMSALVRARPDDNEHGQMPTRKRLRELDNEHDHKPAHHQYYDTINDQFRTSANNPVRDEAFPPSRTYEREGLLDEAESHGHRSRKIKREETTDLNHHIPNSARNSVREVRGIHSHGRHNEEYAEFERLPRRSDDRARDGRGFYLFEGEEDIYGYENDRDHSYAMPRRRQAYDDNERTTVRHRHIHHHQASHEDRRRTVYENEHRRPSEARQHATRREREEQRYEWEDNAFEAQDRCPSPQQEQQEERRFKSVPSPESLNDPVDRSTALPLSEDDQPKPTRTRPPPLQDEIGARDPVLAREMPTVRTSNYIPARYPVGYEKRRRPLQWNLSARPRGSKIHTNALLRVPFPLWPDKITAEDQTRLFPKLYGVPHEFDFGLCREQFWNMCRGCTRGTACNNNHARPSEDWVQWSIQEEICKSYILGYMLQCYDSHPPSMDQLADKSVFICDLDEDGQPRYKALAKKE